jgi:hypothetical protein
MTTAQAILATAAGPSVWRPAPAPPSTPHFARAKGSAHATFCADTYLNSAIFGPDYEWSHVADPPAHTVSIIAIFKSGESARAFHALRGFPLPPSP